MKFIRVFGLVLTAALLSPTLQAADADERAQIATDTRQGLLKVVVSYFGPLVGMARGQIPFNAELVETNATKISTLVEMIPDVFRTDTRGADVETEALDHIWDNMDDFAGKAATVAERATALAGAASGGQDNFMQAFGATGGACKACHDEYRVQQ